MIQMKSRVVVFTKGVRNMNKLMNVIFAMIIISMIFMVPVVFASAAENIQTKGITIINAILWIGYAIALGMVVYIGIKYMLGAADAKANMKNAILAKMA